MTFLPKRFALVSAAMALATAPALAQEMRSYEVTVTNMTEGQPFSPGVIVTHRPDVHVFQPGQPPSEGIIKIAEDGMPDAAMSMLDGLDGITDVVMIDASIMRMGTDMPNSASLEIEAADGDVLSVVTMLICTNDGFTGVDSMALGAEAAEAEAVAYDAGSEINNELTNSIVDPCGMAGPVEFPEDGNIDDLAEDGGIIAEHNTIQGVGELTDAHDWSGPVATISVQPTAM